MFRQWCLKMVSESANKQLHFCFQHSSKYKCLICECSFSTEVSYNYHTNKHFRRYQCSVCSERFANKRAVMKHYNIVHCFA